MWSTVRGPILRPLYVSWVPVGAGRVAGSPSLDNTQLLYLSRDLTVYAMAAASQMHQRVKVIAASTAWEMILPRKPYRPGM